MATIQANRQMLRKGITFTRVKGDELNWLSVWKISFAAMVVIKAEKRGALVLKNDQW